MVANFRSRLDPSHSFFSTHSTFNLARSHIPVMGLPVANPTYLLAPNWTFRPDGPIALGNIIANPLKPHIVLTRPDPTAAKPEVTTAYEKNVKLVDERGRSLSLSLWANFLETVQLKIGAEQARKLRTEYTIETLETTYFRDGVTPELVMERAKDPIVRALMKPDTILSKPVYMVTGIKIAKGFHLSSEGASKSGGELGATLPTGSFGSAGGEGKIGSDKGTAYDFSSDEVVFAYQLLKMAPKGWGEKRLVYGTEYQSTGVFLSDDGGDGGDVPLEIEFSYFKTADLNDFGLEPNQAVNEKKDKPENEQEEYSIVSSKDNSADRK